MENTFTRNQVSEWYPGNMSSKIAVLYWCAKMHFTLHKSLHFFTVYKMHLTFSQSLLRIWPHLLRKFLIENFILCAVCIDSNISSKHFSLTSQTFTQYWGQKLMKIACLVNAYRSRWCGATDTAQKMKFSIKDFFSKCDQISSFLFPYVFALNIGWMSVRLDWRNP